MSHSFAFDNIHQQKKFLLSFFIILRHYFCAIMKYLCRYLALLSLIYFLSACKGNSSEATTTAEENNTNPAPPLLSFNIVKVYPHDTSSFTEGLLIHNSALYESTGLEGHSKLRKINIETGK